ncbi:MAG: glycosyltransferase family 9 protein [Candidatus Eremiobacteraeota bacterium]|nr:glycosyltransferase family 9 protein [Candidatus Eremiobacteraeota bacterium]MCW5869913.1 glycosyltransferase family 9 protein [Candidatus Eremiobacteraeota bacterium]
MSLPLRKILIIHTGGGIGDVLLSTAVVQALGEAYPDSQIDFLCQSRTAAALTGHPLIQERFEWPERRPQSLNSLLQWAMLLRGKNYDASLVLWSNTQVAWLTFLAGIPIRVGQDSRLAYSFLYTHKVRVRSEHGDEHSHWSEILLDFVRALGVDPGPPQIHLEIAQGHRERAAALLEPLAGPGPLIAFHPFKGPPVPLQRWPLTVFADWLRALRHELGARLVVTGSPGEKPYADQIIELAGPEHVLNLAGQTDLATLAALAQQVDVFVCPDSGPMHVAAAAGARVLGIYAMEEDFPRRWAPLSEEARVLRPQPTGCPPGCRKPACLDFRCYRSVPPQRVVEEVAALLGLHGRPGAK